MCLSMCLGICCVCFLLSFDVLNSCGACWIFDDSFLFLICFILVASFVLETVDNLNLGNCLSFRFVFFSDVFVSFGAFGFSCKTGN